MSDRLWRPPPVPWRGCRILHSQGRRVVCSAKQIRTKGHTEDNEDPDHWEEDAFWWDELAPLVAPEKKAPDAPSVHQRPSSTTLMHGPRLQSGQFSCTQDWRAFRACLVALEQADSLFLPWPCASLADQCLVDGCNQDWAHMHQQNPISADIRIAGSSSSSANMLMFNPATVIPASNLQQQQQQERPHGAPHSSAAASSASPSTSSPSSSFDSKSQGVKRPHQHSKSSDNALSHGSNLVEHPCAQQQEESSSCGSQKRGHKSADPFCPLEEHDRPSSLPNSSSQASKALHRRRETSQSSDEAIRRTRRLVNKYDDCSHGQSALSQGSRQKPVPRSRSGSGTEKQSSQRHHRHHHHHHQQQQQQQQNFQRVQQHRGPNHLNRPNSQQHAHQQQQPNCTFSQRRQLQLGAGPASWAHMLTHPEPGCLLLSKAGPDGTFFDRTVVLVTSHDEGRGSVGFMLNKPSPMTVCELRPATDCPGFTDGFGSERLQIGGPNHLDRVTVLHRYLGLAGSHQVSDRLFTGGLPDAVKLVQAGLAMPCDFSLMLGASGWAPRQLASEIERGNWYCVAASPDLVLPRRAPGMAVREGQDMWSRILAIAAGPDAVPKWHF